MEVRLSFEAEAAVSVEISFLQRVAEWTLQSGDFSFLDKKIVTLNAVAVETDKIRELNRTYRDLDRPTDILSFGEYPDREALAAVREETVFLGELYFCPVLVADAAKADTVSFEREMTYVFSHGILHLLGYDHEAEMFRLQDAVTDTLAPN